MKHRVLYALLLIPIVLLMGCKKSDSLVQPGPSHTITVLEKTTGRPIEGANVYLEKCRTDVYYGECPGYSTVATLPGTTDSNGQIRFTPPARFEYFKVEKASYWTNRQRAGSGQIVLSPKSTIITTIIKVRTYLTTDVLHIIVRDPNCSSYFCWRTNYVVGLPDYAVFNFHGQGNSENQISWAINYVYLDSLHPLTPFYMNRFDTVNVEIRY